MGQPPLLERLRYRGSRIAASMVFWTPCPSLKEDSNSTRTQ